MGVNVSIFVCVLIETCIYICELLRINVTGSLIIRSLCGVVCILNGVKHAIEKSVLEYELEKKKVGTKG